MPPDAGPPDFATVAQARLDHIAAQRAQPPPSPHDLEPPSLAAFREHLSRSGARETCMACDVDRWIARREFQPRPTIAKVCLHCGFIAYFDMAVVGIEPSEPERMPHVEPFPLKVIIDGREQIIMLGA